MHVKPGVRASWGFNAKKAWYVGPALKHYCAFRGVLPSTKGERISDSVKFQHHAIAMPELTPADKILEATRALKRAITQQPKAAPSDEVTAIELLRKVMLGEQDTPLPANSVQKIKAAARESRTPATAAADDTPEEPLNYVSDDEDEDCGERPPPCRSQRILSQRQPTESESLNRVVALAAKETAVVPPLSVEQRKLTRGYVSANLSLQLDDWAYDAYFVGAILDEKTGDKLEYRDLIKRPELRERWMRSLANELGRLSQGIRDIKGTNTIYFVPKSEIPPNRRRDITYGRIVVAYKPDKLEKHRSRLTVGGDRINYPGDTGAPTADLPIIKLLWNSVLSTPGAKYFTMDISNFYLGSPLPRPEFMRLPIRLIPDKIIQKYNLKQIEEDGTVYLKIVKGMYGLPQAGKIANELLIKRMRTAGYHPCQFTPGLWRHVWRPVTLHWL